VSATSNTNGRSGARGERTARRNPRSNPTPNATLGSSASTRINVPSRRTA
jgi:hypothetical protein